MTRNMISTLIFTAWNSLKFYPSCDVNLTHNSKQKSKGQIKTGKVQRFNGVSYRKLNLPCATMRSPHLYNTPEENKAAKVNGAKYMETMFIMNVSNIEAETKGPIQVTARPILESKSGVLLM